MVTAHQEQSKVNDRRASAIMGRRQELNLQLNQLIDAVILVLCLCGAHAIRLYLGNFYGVAMIEPFKSYLWLIVLIMPFGPLATSLPSASHRISAPQSPALVPAKDILHWLHRTPGPESGNQNRLSQRLRQSA